MRTLLLAAMGSLFACTISAQMTSGTVSHTPTLVIPEHELHEQIKSLIAEAKEKGSSGVMLADYGNYKLQISVRTQSGGAEVHAHWNDVMIVKEGQATLITGGTVIGGESKGDGETLGTRIEGGESHPLGPGDVFTVRAGTPHQTLVAAGTVYAAVVIKVREP